MEGQPLVPSPVPALGGSDVNTLLKRRQVERQTLTEQIYNSLKQAIVSGDLRPGQRLKELQVAQSLGASRTPVREALSKLKQDGFVKPLNSGGVTVVELSEHDVMEIFGLSKVLECYAARLAAEHVTPKQIERLEALCDHAEECIEADEERLSGWNRRFHMLLIEVSGQKRLLHLITNLRLAMQPYRVLGLKSVGLRRSSVQDHRRMIEALRAGDGERLSQMMNAHLQAAQAITLAAIQEQARFHEAATT